MGSDVGVHIEEQQLQSHIDSVDVQTKIGELYTFVKHCVHINLT